MPSLIDIRRRIRAVKSTQQITKAMKMVAAANLRRSQERILNARPMAKQIARVLSNVAARVDPAAHPLLAQPDAGRRPPGAADRDDRRQGDVRQLQRQHHPRGLQPHRRAPRRSRSPLGVVGRRGRDYFARRGYPLRFEMVNVTRKPSFEHAQEIGADAIAAFTSRQVDEVFLAYNEFKSVLQQRIVIRRLLPLTKAEFEPDDQVATVDYLYEPTAQQIFDDVLPRLVNYEVYTALLESAAAQNAAQMVAMDNATKNSAEVIDTLTLTMNKVRQAAITREIIEVVSGAEAL